MSQRCQYATTRSGEPYAVGQYVAAYTCAGCKRPQHLSPADWARLSEMRLEDFHAHAHAHPRFAAMPTRDLCGVGLTQQQAEDMFRAGFQTAHDVAALGGPDTRVDLRRRQPRTRDGRFGRVA